MKFFKKVLKNKLFYLFIVLGVFVIPIFNFNLQAQELETVDYSNKNLAVPDLEGKEYLGDGEYRIFIRPNGFSIYYNVVTGVYTFDGESQNGYIVILTEETFDSNYYYSSTIQRLNENYSNYTSNYIQLSGIEGLGFLYFNNETITRTKVEGQIGIDDKRIITIYFNQSAVYNNFQFKLQVEKGSTATPYTVPLQAYLWHEKQLSYDEGYNDAFDTGYDVGKDYGQYLGYIEARDEYGIYINDEWISATDYGGIQYNEARDEYGIFINDEWLSAVDYGALQYNDGYQDGTNDTHDYYNYNGLFIPITTPKAHLVVDYDQRYGEPYFYLQDFYNVDGEYFSFQHNRWLEKAFDWAYSVQEDFLAINDLYTIKYESDEVIYKYFFYKYDTDSIYFYNDNGTLLKIVERALFDYYIYEVPELSQEVQALIDNAYNRGMWDYGYYDSGSEEYLTATEYGEIQYNKGVISTRDKAYADGFMVGVWDSHRYGYDWVRVTYYELIAERPILNNVSDLTSFAYQEGYGEGFDDGEDVGYDKGYEIGLDDGYDDGLLDGFDDGYEVGYWKGYDIAIEDTPEIIYDEIYNKGYRDGQKTGMNNKFYTGLEKWIVPAIIVVLFFGLLMLFPRNKED